MTGEATELYFIDSSAYAKLFVQEDGSQELIRLIETTEDNAKTISTLAPLEVRSAIRRRERLGDISAVHAAQALSALTAESRRLIEHPITAAVLSRSSALLDRHALRSLDALQLATALVVRESLASDEPLFFLGSDLRLLQAAAMEDLQVLNPTQR